MRYFDFCKTVLIVVVLTSCTYSILEYLASRVVPNRQIEYENAIYKELSNKRTQWGIQQLVKNKQLVWSGRLKAEQMEKTCKFSHSIYEDKDWIKTIEDSGYTGLPFGEVLARGFIYPENVVKGWVDSPSHMKQISAEHYKNYGIYAYKSKCDNKIYVVGHFGN